MNAVIVNISANQRFVQHPRKSNDYYMVMDGVDDMLEVYHTDALLLGDNNGDYTISLTFLQTIEIDIQQEWEASNIIYKGHH